MEISHEEFNAIIKEKQKYDRMKENVKNVSKKQENMRLNSVNSKKVTSFYIIYELGFQNKKTILIKDTLKIGLKKFFVVSKIKDSSVHIRN